VRRAKIVCTLGPATESLDAIRALVASGMNVARLNMSHGSHEEQLQRYHNVRQASDESGKAVGILADLQGPKIRLGTFSAGKVRIENGDRFTITIEDVDGNAQRASTTYKGLPGDVKPGDRILIDDGRISLLAVSVTDTEVVTEVVEGGFVSNSKGINLPGVAVSVPALSDKDIEDLRWALRTGVDIIALSFVRNAADYADVKKIMDEEGISVPVIAKIEKPQAVENLDEIIAAFDGIMVARGDLGVELPLEEVPIVQKRCIMTARLAGRPVIVATQMLDSMEKASRPTRAEVSDVANAVLDGADALMLSGETSVGEHPFEAVQTMSRIIEHVESQALGQIPHLPYVEKDPRTGLVVTWAATEIAHSLSARFLVAFTETGHSARALARHRRDTQLLAFTPHARTRSVLSLVWGVDTYLVPPVQHTDHMVDQLEAALLASGRVSLGEKVVIVAGAPPGIAGGTNSVRVHTVGRDR
jgi:pyruvate kinase